MWVHYVKKLCNIVHLYNYYDMLAVSNDKIFICSVNTNINGKTINSKIPLKELILIQKLKD